VGVRPRRRHRLDQHQGQQRLRRLNCQTRNNWLGTARGRVGYSFDRFLPYFTGGLAIGDVEANRTGFAGSKDTNAGWTDRRGIEGVIAGNWTAKVEYLYADLGDTTCSAVACGVATNVDLQRQHRARRLELPLLKKQPRRNLKPRTSGPGLQFFLRDSCRRVSRTVPPRDN
jgi:hypothetical protein